MLDRHARVVSTTVAMQSSQVLFDYLAGETFRSFDKTARNILLQTAFLPTITGSLAQKLTGNSSARALLARLHEQNYFTVKRPGNEPVYEYHPLFREFLIDQANKIYEFEQLTNVRRTAAILAETVGNVEAAATLLRDAQDHEGLVGLICRHAPIFIGQGRNRTVEEWLAFLPEDMVTANSWLLYWRGISVFASQHTECQNDLQRAFAAFRLERDSAGMLSAWSALIVSHQAEGNTVPIDDWIARFDKIFHQAAHFPSEEIEGRVAAAMLSAIVVRKPAHPDGVRWAQRALELTREHPDLVFRAITAFTWFYYHYQMGDFGRASVVVDEMRGLMGDLNLSPVVRLVSSMSVALHELTFALPSYRRTVSDMLDLTRTTGLLHTAKHVTLGIGITAALGDGDWDTADRWIHEMERDVTILTPGYKGWYYGFLVRTALVRGELDRAAAHQPEMLHLLTAGGAAIYILTAHIVSAEILGRRGEKNRARVHLDEALKIAFSSKARFLSLWFFWPKQISLLLMVSNWMA